MQNQLKFNLDIALAASNVAVRYHKPAPIVVERAGGMVNIPHTTSNEALQKEHLSRSSIADDRMALAVQLAKRDLKKQREGAPLRSRESSPKAMKSHISKGGTTMLYTRKAKERSQRFQDKQSQNNYLKVREQGWNVGIPAAPQTPPRNKAIKSNLPASTNSPPTRDVNHYPDQKGIPNDSPDQEINRMQKEMEHYLQQIQVIEQNAMKEHSNLELQPPKTRRKDGYLDDDEDPTRVALRQEEQVTRSARQLYFLRQQVRALQEHVTRGGKGRVKHTKKSQIMLRLAAAHRGAVRAIQSFVNHQLPQQDLKQGLPMGYHELAHLIRQLALLSTQIQTNQDTAPVHKDLINMLDRVEELNQAWCEERVHKGEEVVQERRHKSPQGQQQVIPAHEMKGRQSAFQHRRVGKENRPKGLLKKQMYKGSIAKTSSSKPRKLTPERHQILQAGLKTFIHENMQAMRDNSRSRQPSAGTTWTIPANENAILEPSNSSLILPKGLQYKRERAQRSLALAVPDTHFSHPTMSYNQKVVQPSSTNLSSREPWKPSGSINKSPNRGQSHDRSRSRDRRPSSPIDRSLSQSPKTPYRNCVVQDVDQELMQELFPDGVDGERRRGRSLSPVLRLDRQRSLSPPRSPESRSRFAAHRLQKKLGQLQKNTEDVRMARKRQYELSEINMQQLLVDKVHDKAHLSGETITDMILNDVLHDTAEELQSLENEDVITQEATTLHNNPTLENIYQRLEQMELEQHDIRRRWGTLHFEEESCSNYNSIPIQQPSGPVSMEITRHGPTRPHRLQNSRMFNSESDVPVAPVIFTKSVPEPVFKQKITRTEEMEEQSDLVTSFSKPIFSYRIKLKISESTVKEIRSNLEKYERHLKSTSHHLQGTFDPTKLMEEISDSILEDCLKEIEAELEDIGENIVHQVCKSEFTIPESYAVPPSPTQDQEIESIASENSRYTKMLGQIRMNPGHVERMVPLRNTTPSPREIDERLRSSGEISEILRSSAERSESVRSSVERYVHHANTDRSDQKTSAPEIRSLKKSVSFIKNNNDEEIGFQNEAIFDAADLDTAVAEPDTEQNDHYNDDYEDDDYDEDDDFDVEDTIDTSDALEYSINET